eukprot:jgi/Chrzof1/6777/Cz19g09030.t1
MADNAAAERAPMGSKSLRRMLLILHGKRVEDEQIKDAIRELKDEGHQITVRVTWDSGDVDQFIKEALHLQEQYRYHTIVAGGGDGTLNELVAALLKYDAPPDISIAQLPLGTANDLASAAGVSLVPADALHLAIDPATAHPIDVALVNGEVFMNIATAGPISEVSSKEMSPTLKKVLGPLAVPIAGLQHTLKTGLKPKENVKITYPLKRDVAPDAKQGIGSLRGDLLVLAAGQGRQMGRMWNVCPDALLDDGLLDFTIMFGTLTDQAATLTKDVVENGIEVAQGGIHLLRVPWLKMEAQERLKINRDGEPSPKSDKLLFEAQFRRIKMHLPDDRLLVSHLPQEEQKKAQEVSVCTGKKVRPRLLSDLWKAQQPPGRLQRALPRVTKMAMKGVYMAALVAAGFGLGWTAAMMAHREDDQ